MAVPDFQSIMLPLLRLTADGNKHTFQQMLGPLATTLQMTDQKRNELLPSGRQRRFDNRVYWAGIYLTRAGLLERPERGAVRITATGAQVLTENPQRVDIKFLDRFPVFLQWRSKSNSPTEGTAVAVAAAASAETPEEQLDAQLS